MKPHPYLRAFLAGAFVPTLILPLMLTGFIVVRLALQFPFPIERGLVFPMALVPSLWAIWNMLWVGSHPRTLSPSGCTGRCCPFSCCRVERRRHNLGILTLGSAGVPGSTRFNFPIG